MENHANSISKIIHYICEILIPNLIGLGLLFTNIDLVLKILVSIIVGGYTGWKWYAEFKERKEKKKVKK